MGNKPRDLLVLCHRGIGRVRLKRFVNVLALLALLASANPPAVDAQSPPTLVNDYEITLKTPAEIEERRRQLIKFLWGPVGIPYHKKPVVESNIPNPLAGLTNNVARVDRLRFGMESNIATLGYHYIPQRKNNRLVIVHGGHGCTFEDRWQNDYWPTASPRDGFYNTIQSLVSDGYSVVAMFMPYYTPEDCREAEGRPHDKLFGVPVRAGSPMKFFLEPVVMAMNYLQSLQTYTEYNMTGLSGGGWTTTVYAALDPKIRYSFPVAGSLPSYLTPGFPQRYDVAGDAEAWHNPFYSIAGYPDLYVMGAYGRDRKQVQILNRRDTCCWGQDWYVYEPSKPGWNAEVRAYELRVREAVHRLGAGSYRLEIDEAAGSHTISYSSQVNVILAELNGGNRPVGAATTANALVRGVNGKLWRATATAFSDTGMVAVGAPAVVEGSQNPIDVFYKDSTPVPGWPVPWTAGTPTMGSPLRHGFLTDSGWRQEELPLVRVIGDPVAVTSGPGRWDVVAFGFDYKLYHWSWKAGSGVTLARVSDTRGIGTPALVATGPNTVRAFFRDWDGKVLHASRDGDAPWVIESTSSPEIIDFPSAVWNGTSARVYARGRADNRLYEGTRNASVWTWTAMSSQQVAGSPGATHVGNTTTVHVRTPDNRAATFASTSGSTSWTFQASATPITASPAAVPGGAWVRGADRDLLAWTGQQWIKRGEVFD